jgi:hypothetical protein
MVKRSLRLKEMKADPEMIPPKYKKRWAVCKEKSTDLIWNSHDHYQ